MQNEINELNDNLRVLQSRLGSTWINLNEESIFDYFPYNDKTGIWTLYNGTDLPSEVSAHASSYGSSPWYTVLKACERMILFYETGVYLACASGKKWYKTWEKL